jgi:hypothetical protein
MPWAGQAKPGAVLQACVDGLMLHGAQAASIPGWARKKGQCNGQEVSYTLEAAGGSRNWVAAMAPYHLRVKMDEKTANLSWPLPDLTRYTPDSPGVSLSAARSDLQAQFDELLIPQKWGAYSEQRFWRSVKIEVKVIGDPSVARPLLEQMPATVITEIKLEPETQMWSISAELYERLNPPLDEK